MSGITVIIPTYRRTGSLLRALRSLQDQTLEKFEILVVDNAADRDLAEKVTDFNGTARVPVRYIAEPALGLHNARHCGVREARHALLVFTDDDATFGPGWLGAYDRAFEKHPEMAAAGGPVRPVWEVDPPQWLREFIGTRKHFIMLSLMEPYQEFHLRPDGYFFGVNMAIHRDVLFEAGGFNPESFGDIWLGDGEVGLYRRLQREGKLIGYVPDAIVYHHIPPDRMTVEYFCRRMANEGASDIYTRFHEGIPHKLHLLRLACQIAIQNGVIWVKAMLLKGRTDASSLRIQLRGSRTQVQLKQVARLILYKDFQRLVLKDRWLSDS